MSASRHSDLQQSSLSKQNEKEQQQQQKQQQEFGVTPMRWYILAMYMILVFATMMQYSNVTVILEMREVYGISTQEVNILAAIYPFMFIVTVVPGCKLVESKGLKIAMMVGSFCTAFGATLKLVSSIYYREYWILVVGNIITASCESLMLGTPPLVASVWFPENERGLATALGSLAGHIGFGVNVLSSPLLVDAGETPEKGIQYMFWFQFAWAIIPFCGVYLRFRAAPKLPPSITASSGTGTKEGEQDIQFFASIIRCFKKPNFLLCMLVMGLNCGLWNAFIALMAQMFIPFGITQKQVGIFSFAAEMFGVITTIGAGKILDLFRGYRKPWLLVLWIQLFAFAIIIGVSYAVPSDLDPLAYFFICCVCLVIVEGAMFPMYPIAMELGVEIIYPEPAVIAGSCCIIGTATWNTTANFMWSYYLGNDPTPEQVHYVWWFLLFCEFLAIVIVTFFLEDDLARLKVERDAKEKEKSLTDEGTKLLS